MNPPSPMPTRLTSSQFQQLFRQSPVQAQAALAKLEQTNPRRAEALRRSVDWSALQGHSATSAAPVQTVHYEAPPNPVEPIFQGTVEVNEGIVQLATPDGQWFSLASDASAPWNLRWGAEVGSFVGQTVTVRGRLAKGGQALMVTEFAPGTSTDFMQGRVLLKGEDVFLNVRPGKQVKIVDPALARTLREWDRVAFILPGKVEYKTDTGEWHFLGTPSSVYLLTKLNPGEGVYYADTPFERVYMTAAENLGGVLPNEKMGQRIFVHGRIVTSPAPSAIPHRRFFEVDWVGSPIVPSLATSSESMGTRYDFSQSADGGSSIVKNEQASFEPQVPQVTQGTKTGRFPSAEIPQNEERWFRGRKLAQGPVDELGNPHGVWTELSAIADAAAPHAAGEAPYRYVATLRGQYEHGQRTGLWVQLIDGVPTNGWEWDHGRLQRTGHLDDEGRPHGEWTFVADDGFRDGGEGTFHHGKPVGRWNWYAPGTTQYQRAALFHDNGHPAARGHQRAVKGDDGIERRYRLGEWEFFGTRGQSLGTVNYAATDTVDVIAERETVGASLWEWSHQLA